MSVHLGSQILSPKPYGKMLKVIDRVINKTNYCFEFIDLGGGFGFPYEKKNKLDELAKKNINQISLD